MENIKIKLDNLTCTSCASKIEDMLNKQLYIDKAVLNIIDQSVKVTYIDIEKKKLLANIIDIVNSIESGISVYEVNTNINVEKKSNLKFIRLAIGLFLILLIFFTNFSFEFYLKVVTFILFGYDVVYKASKKIFSKDIFNENFLMSFATISAFAIGEVNEAIGVMLFYQIGEFFQDLAVDNSKKSIENLMDIQIENANLISAGNIQTIKSEEIKINDILLVRVGEKVPTDGLVIGGESRVDTSSLTGEGVPRLVKLNDEVLSGVINLEEPIKIKATKVYNDSTVAKIIELVKDSTAHKGKTEKFITKFAKVYTPIVLCLAFLLVLVPTIINPENFNIWFERSLVFLVVSCPCALVASIPLTFFSGLGYASKNGILIKGSNYLQAVTKISSIVFDKTGTITKGRFTVTDFKTKINENEFFNIVYNVEKYSNHPIAKSVTDYVKINYETSNLDFKITELAGKGLKALNNQSVIYIGNSTLLKDIGVEHKYIDSIGSCIYIALNNEYIGHIIVSDIIKEESFTLISGLKSKGIETIMLTGDKKEEANYVANAIKIDKIYSDLLPQNKVEKLDEICNKNSNITVFVGDGINDAPVLKRSDVGIAMGSMGSDAAINASDIVIMNDDLSSISKLITIANNTIKIAKQNIVFALSIKLIILLLGAIGLASMWLAIFADVGVTVLAVLNASRKK
ncbi:MAG: heavy metal translocating P-type ATPase [Bacilli bacterium]